MDQETLMRTEYCKPLQRLIRAFSDFKAFLYILTGGFSDFKAFLYILIGGFSDFKAFLYILIGGFSDFKAFLYILIGGFSDFKAFLYILIGGFKVREGSDYAEASKGRGFGTRKTSLRTHTQTHPSPVIYYLPFQSGTSVGVLQCDVFFYFRVSKDRWYSRLTGFDALLIDRVVYYNFTVIL